MKQVLAICFRSLQLVRHRRTPLFKQFACYTTGLFGLSNGGYLLPIVIALGLGVSVVGFTALNVISQNSNTLSTQQYNQLATEAARAGLTAAITCVNSGTTDWDTGGKPKLQPQTDCHGANVAGKLSAIVSQGSIQTTYTVDAIANPYSSTSRLLTSTGTVTTKDALGRSITIATKTLRTYGTTSSSNGIVTDISSGDNHSCAITDNKAYCWGENVYGEIGDGTTNGGDVPTPVDTTGVLNGKTLTAISAGANYTCAVADGKAYCWGLNSYGNLGDGTTAMSKVPIPVDTSGVLNGKTVTAISAGDTFTCAIADGLPYCWGQNAYGQLGDGTNTNSNVPVAVYVGPGAAAQPSVPNPCGGWFQPNCKSPAKPAVPASPLYGTTITDISAGNSYACAVANGKAYCWGDNDNGQLGNNKTANSSYAVAVDTSGVLNGKTVTGIDAGDAATCAVANGQGYCWGDDSQGQLGNGQSNAFGLIFKTPVAVDTSGVLNGKTMTDISSGGGHTCAVANSLEYCWGYSFAGAIGNNTWGGSVNTPTAVDTTGGLNGKQVTATSAGQGDFSCAIANSKAYCWGNNVDIYGGSQLGDGGGTSNRTTPFAVATAWTTVSPTATVISSASTDDHSCAVMGGRAYCWGNNFPSAALGIGVPPAWGPGGANAVAIPSAVDTTGAMNGKTVTDVSTANGHSCAVASGAAYCWGDNVNGDLGNRSLLPSVSPVAVDTSGVLSGKIVTAISAAASPGHSCAIANGQAYCWGANESGELGNGKSGNASNVPVAVYADAGSAAQPSFPNPCGGWFQPVCITNAKPATPTSPLYGKTVTAISVNANDNGFPSGYSCAVADGKAYCWGDNYDGQLGNNSTTDSSYATPVDTSGVLNGKTVTDISAGIGFACAVADGKAYCWGSNGNGQLGNNKTASSYVPVAVDTSGVLNGKTVTAVSAGSYSACAVADGKAYCWGSNDSGMLGNNSTVNSKVPVAVDMTGALSGQTVTDISVGPTFTCAVASGKVYCWGRAGDLLVGGMLGNGANTDAHVPVAVIPPDVIPGAFTFSNSMSF